MQPWALVNVTYQFQARSAQTIAHSVPDLVAVYAIRILFVNKVKQLFDFIEYIWKNKSALKQRGSTVLKEVSLGSAPPDPMSFNPFYITLASQEGHSTA
jgi:hypothetical protein